MRGRTRTLLATLAACATWLAGPATLRADVTDFVGLWRVAVTPDATAEQEGRTAFKDLLLFEDDGKVTAEAFGPMGFPRAAFTVTTAGGADAFGFTMSNAGQGTVVFAGQRSGDRLAGTVVWTLPDGAVVNYTLAAERADKESAAEPG